MTNPSETLDEGPNALTPAGRSYVEASQSMQREIDALVAFLEARGRTTAAAETKLLWAAFRQHAGYTFAAREAVEGGSRVSPRVSGSEPQEP